MTGRERINTIFNNAQPDHIAFWAGKPTNEAQALYNEKLDVADEIDFSKAIGNDAVWVPAELMAWENAGKPNGRPLWDTAGDFERKALDGMGVFAECETLSEVEQFNWPDPETLDFTGVLEYMQTVHKNGMAVFGGPWTYISTLVTEFFGMEQFFLKLYTDPMIVEAVIDRIVDFYLTANRRFFEQARDELDVFFFASDLGTQSDLMISPEQFNQFFLPGFKKIVDLAKEYDLKVMLHSCGAVYKLIPTFIDIGIDGLHPLQAKAKDMSAEKLASDFKDHLVFVGGVDTQELLPFASAEEVKREVTRLIDLFGERYVASPSHEGVLPNVSLANLRAIKSAAENYRY